MEDYSDVEDPYTHALWIFLQYGTHLSVLPKKVEVEMALYIKVDIDSGECETQWFDSEMTKCTPWRKVEGVSRMVKK